MSDEIEVTFQVEDFSVQVLSRMNEAIDRSLYAAGISVQEGATNSISGLYTEKNKAVDTGRLRASISFITPQGMSGFAQKAETSKETDILRGKAESKTMVFGSNVEYASYVHNGSQHKNVKIEARPFLREGLDKKKDEIKSRIEKIFKGEL